MRLIDADLLKQNCKITGNFENNFQCVDLITLGEVIDKQPTVDAVPVVRGEWVEYQVPHIICCSECDYGTGVNEKTNFCPNCGADMRKKVEE